MSVSNEKESAFLAAISKYAEQQRNDIQTEVENFKAEELKKAENEVLSDAYTLIQKEMAQMRKEVAAEISHEEMEGRKKLFLKRQQITDEVFQSAKEKLITFTGGPDYPALLSRYAAAIAGLLTEGGTVLYLREADLKYAELVKKAYGSSCEVKADDSILIGGIRGANASMGLVADETLDSKLRDQADWFFGHSGLSVV